jgi:hypothetical protein
MEHGSTPLQSSRAGPQVGVGPTAPQAQSLVRSRSRLPPVLPAGPRNYFPVIARAPPPPAACFRPGGALCPTTGLLASSSFAAGSGAPAPGQRAWSPFLAALMSWIHRVSRAERRPVSSGQRPALLGPGPPIIAAAAAHARAPARRASAWRRCMAASLPLPGRARATARRRTATAWPACVPVCLLPTA